MLLQNNIPLSYVFGKIKREVFFMVLYTSLIAIVYDEFHFTRISIPLSVPMVLGTVISLLLAFRSSQAYDRWWEARMIWGAIVNDSRSLARQISTLIPATFDGDDVKAFKSKFIYRQMAWCHSLTGHLRLRDGHTGIGKFLQLDDESYLSNYANIPSAILELHGHDLNHALEKGWINEYQQVEIDKTLTRLCDSMGACERIKNTVFPSTYSLYIHMALNFFILLLPFALIQYFDLIMIPLVVAIAVLFLLIEKMAIHLQDPFDNKPTDTPMITISNTIERDLKQMLRDKNLPEMNAPDKTQYYVM